MPSFSRPFPLAGWSRALAMCLTLAGTATTAQTPAPAPAAAVAGETSYGVILKLKPEPNATPQRSLARLSQVFQGQLLPLGTTRRTGGEDTYLVRWERPLSSDEAARLLQGLQAHPAVQWVAPNVMERPQQVAPNDPVYNSSQWWLSAVPGTGSRGVPSIAQAWARATGSAVNVAVVDTGLLRTHPDLTGTRFDTGYDLVTNDDGRAGDGDGPDADFSDPGDGHNDSACPNRPAEASSWHGTSVASQIGALTQNGLGVAGINWQVRIISVRVARTCGALTANVVDGLRWAGGLSVPDVPPNPHPARIINLSFGSANTNCQPFQETLDELRSRGVLLIAAAGDDDGAVNRPARCLGALGVGALNRDGFKARYTSLGAEVGISTVGGDLPDQSASQDPVGAALSDTGIVMAGNDGTLAPGAHGYVIKSGTSFSAPVVAGVASLMLSVNPSLTLDQLVYGMQVTARTHVTTSGANSLQACAAGISQGRCYCTRETCGAGILDAPAALTYASNPSAYGEAPAFGVAATPTPAPTTPATGSSSGGGGLFFTNAWLALGLVLSVVALRRTTR
jgi:serine protease